MNNKSLALKGGRARDVTHCHFLALTTRFFRINASLPPRGTGSLIRPLMSLNRYDVKKLCQFWEMPIYPDATNQEIAFSRNRIRKQLFPALRLALNPQVDHVLSQSAEILLAERLHADLLLSKLWRTSQPISRFESHRQFWKVPQAAWIRFPKRDSREISGKSCHGQRKCTRLLFQCSRCFFLPQIGGLFVNLVPSTLKGTQSGILSHNSR